MSHLYDKESQRVLQAYSTGTESGHCAYIDYLESELTRSRQENQILKIGSAEIGELFLIEQQENIKLKDAMQWFCDRVDKGEVRSIKTYKRFKELLSNE